MPRYSIEPGDSGYSAFAQIHCSGHRILVNLDNVPQFHVITADKERALVVRYKLDEAGKPLVDEDREKFVTEVVHGVVRFEIVPVRVL